MFDLKNTGSSQKLNLEWGGSRGLQFDKTDDFAPLQKNKFSLENHNDLEEFKLFGRLIFVNINNLLYLFNCTENLKKT